MPAGEPGRRAQLLRHFVPTPKHWPIAALARQTDVGDAAGAAWLRADPVHIRPDINGARLLAYGDALGIDVEDRDALLPALRPLFGDAGIPIDAPTPARWYFGSRPETAGAINNPVANQAVAIQKMPNCVWTVRLTT